MSNNRDDGTRKPRLMPVSRQNTGNKFMTCQCFSEIDRRIRLGWTTTALVKSIQEEFGELKELSPIYLKKLLDEYRASIPPAELSMLSSNSMIARNATKKIADGINELDELEKLYKIQMDRINIDYDKEKMLGKLMNNTGREVFVAMKILRQSAELKMDLGLIKRQLGTMEVTGQVAAEVTERYGKDSIGKVISDPDSRRKVLGLAERLFQLGAKAGIDVADTLGKIGEEVIIDTTVTSDDQIEIVESAPELP